MKHIFHPALAAAFAVLFTTSAFAQANIRVRGTIEKVDGGTLTAKTREGTEIVVKLAPDAKISGVMKTSLDNAKPGTFVGVAAAPGPGGQLMALEVLVFPDSMRGTGEGHHEWDLKPNSSMTNATVTEAIVGADGKMLSMKYKDGEKKIVVPPTAPVVTYVPGDAAELKPGVKIFVFAANKMPDGSLETGRLAYGKDGLTPPM